MRIGLLNNLRAGRSDKQVSRLLRYIERYSNVVSVETDSAQMVPEALADLARQEVDLLVVNGGDGTLQHALTEVLGNRAFDDRVPLIAPLRGGRTNMSALDLGMTRDPVKSMAALIDAAKAGTLESRIVPRQVLRVGYGPGRDFLYGMFFGGGMIYRAIELFHKFFPTNSSQGVLGATMVTTALIGRVAMRDTQGVLTPNKVQVLLDGEPVPHGEYLLLISTTLGRLFARMRPFWGRGEGAVRFTSIATGAEQFAKAAPGVLRGRPRPFVREESGWTSRNVKRAELRLDCGFTVDGELIAPEPGRSVTLTANDRVSFVRA